MEERMKNRQSVLNHRNTHLSYRRLRVNKRIHTKGLKERLGKLFNFPRHSHSMQLHHRFGKDGTRRPAHSRGNDKERLAEHAFFLGGGSTTAHDTVFVWCSRWREGVFLDVAGAIAAIVQESNCKSFA